MNIGVKIKDGKIVTKQHSSMAVLATWFMEDDEYCMNFNGMNYPYGSSEVIKDFKLAQNVYFKDQETIEKCGYHLSVDGSRAVKTKPDLKELQHWDYEKYNLTTKIKDTTLGTVSPTHLLSNGMQYTFGVEIETSGGSIPYRYALANKLNVKSDYDGSVNGGEYITGILKGDAGFIHLNKLLKILRKTTTINKTCGIHVHIGGADFNKAFTVFSYLLGLRIEKEVFQTLPKSRSHNRYCDFLYKLESAGIYDIVNTFDTHGYEAGVDMIYDWLYRDMSYGDLPGEYNNKMVQHKHGRYCGQYHDVPMEANFRYKWLNLIPCNFNMKGAHTLEIAKKRNTIEFRNHSASLSSIKIRNWVLFCMAYVSFVENNKSKILDLKTPLNLDVILKEAYGRKANPLINYFNERKKMFSDSGESTEYNQDKINEETDLNKKIDVCVL